MLKNYPPSYTFIYDRTSRNIQTSFFKKIFFKNLIEISCLIAIAINYCYSNPESQSCSVVSDSLWLHELCSPWNSPGQKTGVGSLSLLQGIFPTQGLNPGLLHHRWILYQLSRKKSPRILQWVTYPFSSRSSQPRSQTGVSCIAGGFFTNWAIREAQDMSPLYAKFWSMWRLKITHLRLLVL